MISLINARKVILTSKKEQSFSKLAKRQLASGKERCFKTNLKRIYSRRLECEATQTRNYPESQIYTIPRWTYSNPKAGIESEAKLNHHGDVRIFTYHQSKQFKVFRSLNHSIANFRKLWRGSCWHSKKDKISNWPEQCLTCWHLQKTSDRQADDQFCTHLRGTNQQLRLYWSSEADSETNCLWRDLSMSKMLSYLNT